MSLLLDALKKAAEQKEKQAEAAKADTSREAGDFTVSDHTETELVHGEDNTEVSEVNYSKVGIPEEGDLTATHAVYDRDEDTQIVSGDDSVEYDRRVSVEYDTTQTQRLEDETEINSRGAEAEDRTEILNRGSVEDDEEGEDKTEIISSQFVEDSENLEDRTEIIYRETVREDDTRMLSDSNDETDFVDQTEIAGSIHDDFDARDEDRAEDESDKTVIIETGDDTLSPSFDEDETMSLLSSEDVSDFIAGRDEEITEASEDDSEVSARKVTEVDDDLSLNLVEEDSSEGATTNNSHAQNTNLQILANSNVDTEEMVVVDKYEKSDSLEQTSTVTATQDSTITAGIQLESLRNENTIIRQDSTSTNTYAPDNYDRTLIRPVNDDASRIFAGMKSEEDVLMTPDYAKRVFLSKSSANRAQYFKVYLGIVVSILLAISIYSMFELQDEYNRIDTTLTPLKSDPLPGVVSQSSQDSNTATIEPDVDRETLKLVENAQLTVVEVEISDVVKTEVESEVKQTSHDEVEEDFARLADSSAAETTSEVQKQEKQVVASIESTSTLTSNNLQQISERGQVNIDTTGLLKISTKQKFAEKDQWLAEAYEAYQRGDDVVALRKYNQVLEVDPKNRNALLARAAISVQNNEVPTAIADYQQLLFDNPKDSLAMSSLISVANLSPQKSETQLKLMIREEPNSPYLNFVLANVYGSQNRWQEAQDLYFKALENNPDDPNYAYNLAVSLEHISKPKVAIAYYERAVNNIDNGLATFNKDLVEGRIELLRRL